MATDTGSRSVPVTVHMPLWLREELEAIAANEYRTLSHVCYQALHEWVRSRGGAQDKPFSTAMSPRPRTTA